MNKSIVKKWEDGNKHGRNMIIMLIIIFDVIFFGAFCAIEKTAEDAGFWLRVMYATIFVFDVIMILYYLTHNAMMKRMIKKCSISEMQIDWEFKDAYELIKDKVYVGEQYLFMAEPLYSGIIKLEDIVWVYSWCDKLGPAIGNERWSVHNYLYICTVDKHIHTFLIFPYYDADKVNVVLAYFLRNVPHVIVGSSWKLFRMFLFDYKNFLGLVYNNKRNGNHLVE
ncbi:MAG: hypothetical protein J6B19_03085 [Lachnospiraceae bacterium]|nr:hypothetical protein [Lachnospiraceae bacterium]